MAQDCFVWYMQGFGMSPIRCLMMPLDTHTHCISNSYKWSPLGKQTFIEELFNHAGCCCCWPGTTSGPWSSPLLPWSSPVCFRGFNVVLPFSACLELSHGLALLEAKKVYGLSVIWTAAKAHPTQHFYFFFGNVELWHWWQGS